MVSFEEFQNNLRTIRARVDSACAACGRKPEDVAILPVTKTHPVAAVDFAAREGFVSVGENRVQEIQDKIGSVSGGSVGFELIGHLQSNKAKVAVDICDRIQSIDSEKLLKRVDRLAGELGKRQRILIQVNSGEDPAKFGIMCADLEGLLDRALALENVAIEGLMTIAPLSEDLSVAQKAFERLRIVRDRAAQNSGAALAELSMGMTGDLEAAIQEGSTQIRVGSALFGARA